MKIVDLMYPRLGYKDNNEVRPDLREQAQALIEECRKAIIKIDKYMELDLDSLEYKHREKNGELISHKCLSGIHYMMNNWPKNRRKQLVIQAGGSLGIWPRALSYYFDWVYTFEPAKYVFPFLCINAAEDNIIKMQAALGNITKGVSLIDGGHAASTCIAAEDEKKLSKVSIDFTPANGNIPMIKIDDLNLNACDAIILDVEKSELIILQGALETIKKYKPYYILVEDNNTDLETCENLKRFLYENAYEFVVRKSKDHIYKYIGDQYNG
jgi:FkbM family methyltransferase